PATPDATHRSAPLPTGRLSPETTSWIVPLPAPGAVEVQVIVEASVNLRLIASAGIACDPPSESLQSWHWSPASGAQVPQQLAYPSSSASTQIPVAACRFEVELVY